MKKIIIVFLLFLIAIFFSFQNVQLVKIADNFYVIIPKINFTDGFIQLYRNLIIEYSSINYRNCELDLTLKFLFNEQDCQIPQLQKEYENLLKVYKPIFEQQYAAFKYYYTKFLKERKKLYEFNEQKLNDDDYLKTKYKISNYLYLPFDLNIEGTLATFKTKEETANISFEKLFTFFNERVDSFLYYSTILFKGIEPINNFYEKYVRELENLADLSELENIYDFIVNNFSIKTKKDYKIFLNIAPIQFIPKTTATKGPLIQYENDYYIERKIFAYCFANYINIAQEILKSRSLYLEYFLHELTHHFQFRSSFIYDQRGKLYFTDFLPLKPDDFSKWNKFLNSFKNANQYKLYEFDAEFTSLYLKNLIMGKKTEKWKLFDEELIYSHDKSFIYDIFNYLLINYIKFCKENKIERMFYIMNCDLTLPTNTEFIFSDKNPNNKNYKEVSENLANFFEKWVYPNKKKIFYDIYRATKFFEFDFIE